MKDLRLILKEISRLRAAGERYALATVVRVSGSAYRGLGARMLIRRDGGTIGTVNGGCLERDVVEQAAEVIAQGSPRLLSYDATDDGDVVLGLGLGCKGVIDIWVEGFEASAAEPFPAVLERCILLQERAVLATVFAPEEAAGQRLVLREDGTAEGAVEDGALLGEARSALAGLLRHGKVRARSLNVEGRQVLFEPLQPPLHLVVCGAGYDAQSLSRLVTELGWRVTVVDPRPDFADPARFPEADAVVQAHPEQAAERVDWRGPLAVQLMTHNYLRDLGLLKVVQELEKSPDYLGVLGPRQRIKRLLDDLQKEGVVFDRDLYGPVGLDIGAENAEEIALSIAAEIRAVCAGRSGGHLREREGPIHQEEG